jgi:hypothetical protein
MKNEFLEDDVVYIEFPTRRSPSYIFTFGVSLHDSGRTKLLRSTLSTSKFTLRPNSEQSTSFQLEKILLRRDPPYLDFSMSQ